MAQTIIRITSFAGFKFIKGYFLGAIFSKCFSKINPKSAAFQYGLLGTINYLANSIFNKNNQNNIFILSTSFIFSTEIIKRFYNRNYSYKDALKVNGLIIATCTLFGIITGATIYYISFKDNCN